MQTSDDQPKPPSFEELRQANERDLLLCQTLLARLDAQRRLERGEDGFDG